MSNADTTRFECYDDGNRWAYAGPATDMAGILADYGAQSHVEMGYAPCGPARSVTITVEQIETDEDGDDVVRDRQEVVVQVPEGDEE